MLRPFFTAVFALATLAVVELANPAAALPDDIAPPDQPGPYNVGVTTFSATMTGGRVTQIQVYYPTLDPPDFGSKYTIMSPLGTYQQTSPLGAVEGGAPAPGPFPLIVYDHGGRGAGGDSQRVAQLPLHETLASHGFVTVVALHSANAVARVRDLPLVLDAMLARSTTPGDLLFALIDPARIGISGFSAGGGAAIGVAGGWAINGIVADPRVKAMVLYEPTPAPTAPSLADASTIAIPYLVMGGLQYDNGLAVPALFDATVNATPRIYVLSPDAVHFSYATGMAAEIDETREQALVADPMLPEPLTVRSLTNPAAARAYELWNFGEILFPQLGAGLGGGRNYCDRVGVNSVRSLDLNGDGFTDSPPFMVDDPPFLPRPAIREEVMLPLVKLYTVAFWKTFLEGDHRYMPYLTPGYANRNQLEALVTIE